MFGSQWYFFWKITRRIIGYYLLNKGEKISLTKSCQLGSTTSNNKKIKTIFLTYFIEANQK